ncbi:MAG: hypothetical protein WD810_03380 [Solirubrobacterales bacterium]
MVRATAARGCGRVPGSLRCVVWLGAVLWCIALSAPLDARAEPQTCPLGFLESAELEQPAWEVRELRNDVRQACGAIADRLDEIVENTAGVVPQLATIDGDLVTLLEGQEAGNGDLKAARESLAGTVAVSAPAGVEVTNQPDTEMVRQAVVDNSETLNQNIWAVLGLVVGFGLLAAVYKLVRP